MAWKSMKELAVSEAEYKVLTVFLAKTFVHDGLLHHLDRKGNCLCCRHVDNGLSGSGRPPFA